MNWQEFWNNFIVWFETEGAIKITSLLLVIIIGFIAIKILLRIIKRMFSKTRLDNTVGDFLLSIIKFCLYLVWVMAMVSSLGVSLTGFTVIATALSLGVSLALENLLSNLVNGFVLISGKMFKEGDWVEIGKNEGEIKGIHILYTRLNTSDNKQIAIPNSQIMTQSIINHSSEENRRVDIYFTISNFESVDKTKQIMKNVASSCEYVLQNKTQFFAVTQVDSLGAKIECRVWATNKNYWNAKFYLIDNIFNELKRNNISLAKENIIVNMQEKEPKYIYRTQNITSNKTKTQNKKTKNKT